jgi:hypothetical protein
MEYFLHFADEAEKPADLSQKFVFKAKKTKDKIDDESSKKETAGKSSKRKGKPSKNLLSFEEVDDD